MKHFFQHVPRYRNKDHRDLKNKDSPLTRNLTNYFVKLHDNTTMPRTKHPKRRRCLLLPAAPDANS